jgi:hypothetical protein
LGQLFLPVLLTCLPLGATVAWIHLASLHCSTLLCDFALLLFFFITMHHTKAPAALCHFIICLHCVKEGSECSGYIVREMGHHSCCNKQKVRRGLWSPEEDEKLVKYITTHGHGCWSSVPRQAGTYLFIIISETSASCVIVSSWLQN